jgi:hypothetical protein
MSLYESPMKEKATVNMEGGKALMKLQLLCQQMGWDFDKTLVIIINDYLQKNEMKITIKSTIANYKK